MFAFVWRWSFESFINVYIERKRVGLLSSIPSTNQYICMSVFYFQVFLAEIMEGIVAVTAPAEGGGAVHPKVPPSMVALMPPPEIQQTLFGARTDIHQETQHRQAYLLLDIACNRLLHHPASSRKNRICVHKCIKICVIHLLIIGTMYIYKYDFFTPMK